MKNLIIGFLLALILAFCFTPAFGVHSKKEARRQTAFQQSRIQEYEKLTESQLRIREVMALEDIGANLKRIKDYGLDVTTLNRY